MKKQTVVIYDIASQQDEPVATVKRVVRTVKLGSKDRYEITWQRKTLNVVKDGDKWLGFVYQRVHCSKHYSELIPVSPYYERAKRQGKVL